MLMAKFTSYLMSKTTRMRYRTSPVDPEVADVETALRLQILERLMQTQLE